MNETRLIALDPSPSDTGWALFVNGTYRESGHIRIPAGQEWETFGNAVHELYQFLDKQNPGILVTETPVVFRNAETQRQLERLTGALQVYGLYRDAEFREMRPTEWRKWCRDGNEDTVAPPHGQNRDVLKRWSLMAAGVLTGKEFRNNNESDAVLIGTAYIRWFASHCIPYAGDNVKYAAVMEVP